MIVSPSILSADWTDLAGAVRIAEQGGADWLHCDVMDGHFVPNLTFGPPMVAALHKLTNLPLDVHLMIDDPLAFVPAFVDAGAAILTVHAEAPEVAGHGWAAPVRSHGEGGASASAPAPVEPHAIDPERLRATLLAIRSHGAKAGLALRPDTSLDEVAPALDLLDVLLVMTVYPGFSGQEFLDAPLATMSRAAAFRKDRGLDFVIEVDGGIAAETGARAAGAGADALVAGHGIYRQQDPVRAIRALKELRA
jgi:ribulose-phosphate 3-epimerase